MNIKKTALNSAIALAISATAVTFNTAQAGALATAVVQLTNFTISHTGGAIVDKSEFTSLQFTSSADTSASFNGVSAPSGTHNPTASFSSDLYSATTGATVADNLFPALSSATGAPDGNYAVGDQLESGSPISGFYQDSAGLITTPTTPGATPVTTGATLKNASYVSINTSGAGSAASNNGLEAKFKFSGISGGLDFNFDISAYLEAFLTPGQAVPSSASASFSVVFSLTDLTNPFAGEQVLNTGTSTNGLTGLGGTFAKTGAANAPGSGITGAFGFAPGTPYTDTFTLHTASLNAAHTYQLSARIQTAADAVAVPAPNVLALLGTGLLGFGFTRKQRAK